MERQTRGLLLLQHAYTYALEQYEGEGWKESVRALEASLRLHHLLCDNEAHCHQESWLEEPAFGEPGPGSAPDEGLAELELFGRVLRCASCLRCCKRGLPVFELCYLLAEIPCDFQ